MYFIITIIIEQSLNFETYIYKVKYQLIINNEIQTNIDVYFDSKYEYFNEYIINYFPFSDNLYNNPEFQLINK